MIDPAALTVKVRAAGGPEIDPTQSSGRASADGVTIEWRIGEGEIVITILQKPWIVSYGAVWSHIDAVFGVSAG